MSLNAHRTLDREIALLRDRLESAEEMRRAIVADEIDGFVVGESAHRVVLLDAGSSARLSVLERLPRSIVTVSHAGQILYANQRFATLVGRSLLELYSMSIDACIAAGSRAAFREFLDAQAADRTLDFTLVHADGRHIATTATSIAMGTGHTSVLLEDAQSDESRDAEHTVQAIHNGQIDGVVVGGDHVLLLSEAHQPYRALVDRMAQGAVTVSRHGDVLYANDRFAAMVGMPKEAVLGQPIRSVLRTDRVSLLLDDADRAAGTVEFVVGRHDGTRLPVEMTVERVDGVDAVTLILEDLSERERHRRIQERAERNDRFLAVLAHELRNPLGSIRNAVEILRRAPASEYGRHAVALIDRQSETLARLVDDLLDVHRLNAGKLVLHKQSVELRTLCENAVHSGVAAIAAKDQQIRLDVPGEPIFVEVDEVRLAQVLGNLLLNATKFTRKGGNIHVTLERTTQGESPVARVTVADDGTGIAPELIERIFEPYVQASDGSGDSGEGLGLGLSVARRLVEMHGGTVYASSEGPGRGSRFIVELPICAAPAHLASEAGDVRSARSLRVLIADDDIDNARSLATILEMLGHVVFTAHDGQEAVALAEQLQPQVAILDVGMPRMDGCAAARALRKRPWAEGLAIYALTGWGQARDRERTEAAGFDRHFVKPIDVQELSRELATRASVLRSGHDA